MSQCTWGGCFEEVPNQGSLFVGLSLSLCITWPLLWVCGVPVPAGSPPPSGR